jgi:dienelactone hydrolase
VRDRIFLQGWSNGGSKTLNVMIRQGARVGGSRAALAFYPNCGREALLAPKVATSASITMLQQSQPRTNGPST